MPGLLSVVATPIGNLDDLSPRAAAALRDADVIACEDTRVTRRLLSRVKTRASLVSYRAANERTKAAELVRRIEAGERVALVTDAGTPGMSDPGHELVAAALDRDLPVEVIPGPSAAVAALVLSGLPTARFVFEGFLPHGNPARGKRLRALAAEERTIVLFEAPHRIERTLADMREALGDRRAAIAREMTKIHEQVLRGTLSTLGAHVRERGAKGEITLIVEGAEPAAPPERAPEELASLVAERVAAGSSRRDAIDAVAAETGQPRRRVYQAAVSSKG
ncbi:MAG: 16S rRNA (cytidine(1402)-2'-O)-methyltransferase [Actinomycetota bacterium]